MHLLVTTSHPSLSEHPDPESGAMHPNLGRLLTPRHTSSAQKTAESGVVWAADNDCFQGLNEKKYRAMLRTIEGLPGCRFVTVPDVVADAARTAEFFEEWEPIVRETGQPVALVAQDGLDRIGVPWDRIDALFIGGSTDWKLGPIAAEFAVEARMRDKWVHWGRVNTHRRIEHIARTGAADSVDGSSWARLRKVVPPGEAERLLDKGLRWCREAELAYRHMDVVPEPAFGI